MRLKNEKYRGQTIQFFKGREGVTAQTNPGSMGFETQFGRNKQEAFEKMKRRLDF